MKKIQLVQDQFNWVLVPTPEDRQPSETQPDQGWTITELLQRYRDGMLTDLETREPIYYDDQDFDSHDMEKLADMDLYDKSQLVELEKQKQQQIKKEFFDKQQQEESAQRRASDEERRDEEHLPEAGSAPTP